MTADAPPAEFALLEGYWEALREGNAIPARAAIEPRTIARILDRAILLERIAPGIARIRLGGLALVDLMGMDLRGMPFTALLAPDSRAAGADALERVFAGPAAADIAFEGERGIGRPALSARLLLLPLRGHSGAIDRAIGVMVLEGTAGRAPRRFVLARVTHRPIVEGPASPAGDQFPQPAGPHGEMAEPAPGWTPAPPLPPALPAPKRHAPPQLRVVWSAPPGGRAGD